MCWEMLAPFAALATTAIAALLAVMLTSRLRTHDYRRFEHKSQRAWARRYRIPCADQRREELGDLLQPVHEATSRAQTKYHNAVVGSAGCLLLAFLALTAGTLPHGQWPLSLLPTDVLDGLERLLIWVDTIAIVSALLLFWRGREANKRWIAARAGTELLRQFQSLSAVFPTATVQGAGLEVRFAAEADRVTQRVEAGPVREIVQRIENFWRERKTELETATFAAEDFSPDGLLVYLRRRPLRQLGWFTDSKERLLDIAERRKLLVLALYWGATALAVIKLAIFLVTRQSPVYLLTAVLIITGMSAAMTAYYMNQNARSLIHRYHTQQRRIEKWLDGFNASWSFDALPTQPLDEREKGAVRGRILEFEELMIEELIDWTHITTHDAIELSP
jgi:hypothetical protein